MLKRIHIKNFKSLADTGDLELKPLTILVGPNSSGKSALIKALLALKQTAESRDLQSALVVNGDYVELGSYRDFIYGHNLKEALSLKLTIPGLPLTEDWDFSLTGDHASDRSDATFEVQFGCNQKSQEIHVNTAMANQGTRQLFQVTRKPAGKFKVVGPQSVRGAAMLRKFYILRPQIKGSELRHQQHLVPVFFFQDFAQHLEDTLKRIRYLGPLRDTPERFYITSGETPEDVGLAGERTVDVLWMQKQRGRRGTRRSAKLLQNVEDWVKKFGFATEIRFTKVSPTQYEMFFVDPVSTIPVNLADVGFGASQVLPVIVEGFYCAKGCTLLIEQPEIHLHPKAQATLGDLLVDISKLEKQVIVETHSEHLLTRVQRRVADETISLSDVAIYYFEPTDRGTKIRPVQLTRYGEYVSNVLPEGFFEEDYVETRELSRAIIKRKRQEEQAATVG